MSKDNDSLNLSLSFNDSESVSDLLTGKKCDFVHCVDFMIEWQLAYVTVI